MPQWLKVTLLVVGIIVALLVACGVIVSAFLLGRGKTLRADANKIRVEAAGFGRGKTPDACVDETFARLQRCDGIICEVKTKLFLTGCVQAAEVPDGFCASIPRKFEIMASARWQLAECARRGHPNDQRCTRVIGGLQDACERR